MPVCAKEGRMAVARLFVDCCLVLIVLVAAVDIFWSISLEEILLEHEENPIAAYVVEVGNSITASGVAFLCGVKVVSTFLVVVIGRIVYRRNPRVGVMAVGGVAAFQLWLLYYLFFG
tara:strand:+ start:1199 stop:1549 length:351 start_codon:yes stop_codon:yes gene_type:complete